MTQEAYLAIGAATGLQAAEAWNVLPSAALGAQRLACMHSLEALRAAAATETEGGAGGQGEAQGEGLDARRLRAGIAHARAEGEASAASALLQLVRNGKAPKAMARSAVAAATAFAHAARAVMSAIANWLDDVDGGGAHSKALGQWLQAEGMLRT